MFAICGTLSRKLSRLSLLSAIMVVFLHSYSTSVASSRVGLVWWAQELVAQGFSRIAVPYFFFAFGFLFFKDWSRVDLRLWIRKMRVRLHTLAMPYILWSGLGLIVTYSVTRFAHSQIYSFDFGEISWWLSAFGIISPPKFSFHLWFVQFIFVLAAFSPILWCLIRYAGCYWLILLAGVSCFGQMVPYGEGQGLFFTCLGGWLACNGINPSINKKFSLRISVLAVLIWSGLVLFKVILTFNGVCSSQGWVELAGIKFNLLFCVNCIGLVAVWLLDEHASFLIPLRYCRDSFFIYCAHGIIMMIICNGLHQIAWISEQQGLIWFVAPALTVIFALLSGECLRRKMPRLLSFLNGGR